MELLKNNFFKRIIISLLTFIMMFNFFIFPSANAASVKTQMGEGQFYYSGTTTGSYVPSENIFSWLVELLAEIVDFLLGLMTMGGRMVFVGWTALFEELITWLLEASSGIPMDIENDVNATSTDGFISSSNNVTIEAIVYNQVPILNANLFERQKAKCVSGTGKFFVVCETCYNAENPVVQEDDTNRNMYAPKPTTIIGKNQKVCKMEECKCPECWETLKEAGYLETDAAGNIVLDDEGFPVRKGNAVTVIKDAVSKWYYVLRLIALAAMLLVLLVIGIKMAISNIASDKALYKRMLADWFVGMILLFLIHYLMVLIVGMNDVFVDFIKDAETGITEVVKKEFYLDNKSNSEMEIGIYQAVRTRAYDPKLINGTTGTILYVTLVFYTIRFVIIYLKRYLTIIILTLIAPGIAFSYAIQKVLSGKSKAFSKWLNEYFINIFIQTVHALVYTIFVSTALKISLDSIAGMIIAFICINFMLKADTIFRKIFKMSGGFADENINSVPSNPKQMADKAKGMISSAKSAATFMTAGSLLKKSPITKAVTAPLRMAGREGVLLASRLNDKLNNSGNHRRNSDKDNEENNERNLDNIIEDLQELRTKALPGSKASKKFGDFLGGYSPEHGVGYDGQLAIEDEMKELGKYAASGAMEENQVKKLRALADEYEKLTKYSMLDHFKENINEFLNTDNFYEYDEKTGKRRRKRSKRRFDSTENRWVRETMDTRIADQLKKQLQIAPEKELKLKNLFTADKNERKIWEEATGLFKGTLLGMGSLYLGLGTVVSSPAIGMGLLASGTVSHVNFLDEVGVYDSRRTCRRPIVDETNKRFSFNRFGKGAKQNITRSILANAESEKDAMVVENVRKNHKTLYRALKLGGAGLIVTGLAATGVVGGAAIATGAILHGAGRTIKNHSGFSPNSFLGRVSKHHFDQYHAKKMELLQDEISVLAAEEATELKNAYAELRGTIDSYAEGAPTEEERAAALELGNAIKVSNGESSETIMLITTEQKVKEASLKDEALLGIVDEVVAKTMVTKILSANDPTMIDNFKTEDILKDSKELIEKKLVGQGVIKEGELESKIKGIEKAIDRSAKTIIDQEIKGNRTSEDASAFDNALINAVIEEEVSKGNIKSRKDISTESIMSSLQQKRQQIIRATSSGNVAAEIRNSGGAQTAEDGNTYRQKVELSEAKLEAITKNVNGLKNKNKTEKERREDKKKRIAALDSLLAEYAEEKGNFDPANTSTKSTDEVIQEIFDNTEDRKLAAIMLENVQNMKKLNKRGDNAKMKTKNPAYHNAKAKADKKKALEKYPGAIPDGSKEYTGGDGRKDLSKELYGPVTDVVDTIKNLNKKK